MAKNFFIGALAVCVIVLLYFLLSNGKQPDSHKYEYEQAQTDLKIVRSQRDSGLHIIDSLEHDAKRRDTIENRLTIEKSYYRKEGDKSEAKVLQYAREIKELRQQGAAMPDKCDSLAIEAENFAYLYNAYKSYSDSLAKVVDSSKADYISALAEQKRLYNELYTKYEQLSKFYDILYKDNADTQKRLRREKLKTKIAALLALIGGAAAVLK
jgi:hypothetical protein